MNRITGMFASIALVFCLVFTSLADVRIKQRVTMAGQSFESTRSIKGSRERTEQKMQMSDPAMAEYLPQIATITQCDLKRRVQINDRKQLYFIDPFPEASETEVLPGRPTRPPANTTTRKGGTLTMSYAVRDTGERKTMFGLQARHLIVTQEMETSQDSCNGPSRFKTEFDGWYADFSADFSCPTAAAPSAPPGRTSRPDCIDRVIMKAGGTAPKGIMLEGTMKMYGADGSVQLTQTTETLELSRAPLDAALFDIPQGYRQAASTQDLYAVTMPGFGGNSNAQRNEQRTSGNTGIVPPMRTTSKSVAINVTVASNSPVGQAEIDQYVRSRIAARGFRTMSGTGDYTVNIQFRQIKESVAGKIGGIFGKVTGTDTKVGKVDIDMTATIAGGSTGETAVKSKFEGPAADAVRAAIDQALDKLLNGLRP